MVAILTMIEASLMPMVRKTNYGTDAIVDAGQDTKLT